MMKAHYPKIVNCVIILSKAEQSNGSCYNKFHTSTATILLIRMNEKHFLFSLDWAFAWIKAWRENDIKRNVILHSMQCKYECSWPMTLWNVKVLRTYITFHISWFCLFWFHFMTFLIIFFGAWDIKKLY